MILPDRYLDHDLNIHKRTNFIDQNDFVKIEMPRMHQLILLAIKTFVIYYFQGYLPVSIKWDQFDAHFMVIFCFLSTNTTPTADT